MPNSAAEFSTDYLTSEQMHELLVALPDSLMRMLGEHKIIVYYGCSTNIHGGLQWKPMNHQTQWLQWLIEDSIEQKIVIPGESDFHFEIPEKRLQITFCHESDIHLDGEDDELLHQFMATEPFVQLRWYTQQDVKRMME